MSDAPDQATAIPAKYGEDGSTLRGARRLGRCRGGFLAEFAFQSLTQEEAAGLEVYIRDFCDLVPELWASCGQALAAAQAMAA